MIGTLALVAVGGAAASLALDWTHTRRASTTSVPLKLACAMAVGLIIGCLIALGMWTADKPDPKPDPKAECFYAAFRQAPALMPRLAPGEKVYGRVDACDGLSPADITSLEHTFQRAFDAAVTR